MSQFERWFLEPMSALTHLLGSVLALLGLIVLLTLSRHEPGKMVSLFVYGASLLILYGASTLLHGLKVSERARVWLNRFDHMAIFLLIAGTYTPIVYTFFPGPWRWPMLIGIWFVALLGMLHKLTSIRIHGFFSVSLYLLLGWGGILPLVWVFPLLPVIAVRGLLLLLLGGLIYSSGFLVYYLEKPDPWPSVFGHHEIWHLFVLGGSLCHYLFILWHVVPAPVSS